MINPQVILALITTFGLFFCIFYILKWSFPGEIKDQLGVFTQLLGTIWTLQMNYFFGSTSGSKAKDDTLGEIAKTSVPPTSAQPQVTIQNAESVKNETKEGDINVDSKLKEPIIPLKEGISQ